jgi:hypothetical protein
VMLIECFMRPKWSRRIQIAWFLDSSSPPWWRWKITFQNAFPALNSHKYFCLHTSWSEKLARTIARAIPASLLVCPPHERTHAPQNHARNDL